MTTPPAEPLLREFQQSLNDCRELYLSSGRMCVQQCPGALSDSPENFVQLMDDLHKGLLIKIYVSIVSADDRWTAGEKQLGRILFDHVWPGGVPGGKLREAAAHVFREAETLNWYSLIRPFNQIEPLRERFGDLQAIATRVAMLVANIDGVSSVESTRLREILQEITQHALATTGEPVRHRPDTQQSRQAVRTVQRESQAIRHDYQFATEAAIETRVERKSREEQLAEALEQLDTLIGLEQVKHEIRTLTNFLNVQSQRVAAGLPSTKLSLHLVFGGNPGTGKTTVARIVGQIYGSMGILEKGHLVETDRSGLVAEYAGQTGPKANQKIDEALDGVLFIDEAYSLVAEGGDDAFGREAIQTLLKRMEDDRERLVVVLAGYPREMERLLRTNPGLSSRFNTKLTFEDYRPGELGRIFGVMCESNHYRVPSRTQARLLVGFQRLFEQRDEHFGNGRLVRNVFENTIRRLANRIVSVTPLTKEILTTIQPEDIAIEGVSPADWDDVDWDSLRFLVRCPGCGDSNSAPTAYLGRRVRCNKCKTRFMAQWGEPQRK